MHVNAQGWYGWEAHRSRCRAPAASMWLLLASLLSAGAVTRAGGDTALDCAGIARRYVGRWTAPPTRVPTQKLVDGPILGNGDLGVTLGGPPEALTWYLGMNQFWALENWRHGSVGHNDLRPFPSPVQVAQVALTAPALAGSAYNLTQDIADGVVRAEFRGANGTLRVVSWVEPHNATVGATLTWDGARPLAARLTTSASAAICVNSSIDGPSGEEVCAPHSTMPVLASSGRSGDVAWVKRMASTPTSSFNITAAVGTRLITSRVRCRSWPCALLSAHRAIAAGRALRSWVRRRTRRHRVCRRSPQPARW